MFDTNSFADRIFSLKKGDAAAFEALAMEAFRYQSAENDVYGRFIKALGVDAASVDSIHKIPFLPISLFKSMKVVTGGFIPQEVFTSSGTTGMAQSRHYVKSLELYRRSFFTSWELHYGPVEDYAVLALLPSYLEREGSSLIVMADGFIKRSRHPESGFFLYQHEELRDRLEKLSSSGVKILLLGVSFALLDFVEKYSVKLPETAVVMETGGMKGRRKEMVREELHAILKEGFGVRSIHSEYGMTELLLHHSALDADPYPRRPRSVVAIGRDGTSRRHRRYRPGQYRLLLLHIHRRPWYKPRRRHIRSARTHYRFGYTRMQPDGRRMILLIYI